MLYHFVFISFLAAPNFYPDPAFYLHLILQDSAGQCDELRALQCIMPCDRCQVKVVGVLYRNTNMQLEHPLNSCVCVRFVLVIKRVEVKINLMYRIFSCYYYISRCTVCSFVASGHD